MNETRRDPADNRDRLIACYRAAVAAAMPGPAVERALAALGTPAASPWILAVGKAAVPMARAAIAFLARHRLSPAGGLIVAPEPAELSGLSVMVGDHPLPGPGSAEAAQAIGGLCQEIPAGHTVYLLLSGGASSLMAGPDEGLSVADLREASEQLLRSGLDIGEMNLVRKRLSRWAGGRLAVALQHAAVVQLVVSDVIGDDLAVIGSGPAVPDPSTATAALDLIDRAELRHRLLAATRVLQEIRAGRRADLPAAAHPAFGTVTTRLVASNRDALAGAAAAGRRLDWDVTVDPEPISGEARVAGAAIAKRLLRYRPASRARLLVLGGETTVRLGGARGRGGRCQELALAASLTLDEFEDRGRVMLLAAGSDGRDGPTDAAGAIVSGRTCYEMSARGIDLDGALNGHDSYHALDAVGALLRVGPTGTNVMDVVLGLVTPQGRRSGGGR